MLGIYGWYSAGNQVPLRLLWLKVYASGVDDAPLDEARALERDRPESHAVLASERDDDSQEQPAWNVKSAPRTVAPWTKPASPAGEPDPTSWGDDELPSLG